MMMEFKEMLIRAKRGEKNAQEKLLEMYRPLLMRESIVEGVSVPFRFQISLQGRSIGCR